MNESPATISPKENSETISENTTLVPKSEPKAPIGKLKFLFVSLESLSGDLAWTVKKEGHEVKAYIKEKGDIDVYDGIIEKVNDWRAWQDWADVIVFDDVEFGHIADK